MGEAAEYEILRRHGVDISDCDSPRARRRKRRQKDIVNPSPAPRTMSGALGLAPRSADDLDVVLDLMARHRRAYDADEGTYIDLMEGWNKHHDPADLVLEPPINGWTIRRRALDNSAVWINASGQRLSVYDMEERHLKNCIGVADRAGHEDARACKKMLQEYYDRRFGKKQGANEMNTQELVTIMQLQAGARLVAVRFLDGQNSAQYTYKWLGDPKDLKEGTMVVVETRNTFALATVVDPNQTAAGKDLGGLKHIVQVVDLQRHSEILTSEHAAGAKLQMAEVAQRLDNYRKQFPGQVEEAARLLGVASEEQVVTTSPVVREAAAPVVRAAEGYHLNTSGELVNSATGEVVGTVSV